MDREGTPDPLRDRVLLGATLFGAALLVWWWRGVLGALFWGALLAYLLGPIVAAVERRGVSRGLSILAVFVLIALALAAVGIVALPAASREIGSMARQIPRWAREVDRLIAGARGWHERLALPRPLDRALETSVGTAELRLTRSLAGLARGMVGALPGLLNLLLAPVVAAYFLAEARSLRQGILIIFPPASRLHVTELLWRLDRSLSGYLRGQVLTAAAVGLMAAATVLLFGLGYALVIGVMAGVTEMIPYVGPIAGAAPAVGLALLRSPEEALWVVLAFVAVHQIEGSLLEPFFEGRGTGLRPLAVLLALFVGAEVGGVVGLALAVPLATTLSVGCRWAWNLFLVPEAFR